MKNKTGFTLIELLVVVLIIAILSAVALPKYINTIERTRSAEALLNLKSFAEAANRYWLANNMSYEGIGSGSISDTFTPNVDIDLPTNGWFIYFIGGLYTTSTVGVHRPTANSLVFGARRIDVPISRSYAFNYFLYQGQIVARICLAPTEMCRNIVNIESPASGACTNAGTTGTTAKTRAEFQAAVPTACLIRN